MRASAGNTDGLPLPLREPGALALDERGIWSAPAGDPVSYPEAGHSAFMQVEEASFWFQHRNACILGAMRRWQVDGRPFVDVGGGNGYVARAIEAAGWPVVLVEPGAVGAANARRRGVRHVVRATLDQLDIAPASLSAVGLFDVIEHLPDDGAVLQRLHGLLGEGGALVLTVPAHRWLWSGEDESAGHHRRYSRRSLHEVLQAAGFEPVYFSGIFGALILPIALLRALPFRWGAGGGPGHGTEDHHVQGGAAVTVLKRLLQRELRQVEAGRPLALGASWLAVARKRGRTGLGRVGTTPVSPR